MGHLNPQSVCHVFRGELKDHPAKPSGGALALMINSEIGAVLAVMRRNVRWGVHYMADDDQLDHSLIHSLKELRKQLLSWQLHWPSISPALYLQPFLDVIRSDETGAPITGVALSSVYKILSLDVLDLETVNVGAAMHLIVDTVTSCRFEVTDPGSEEVVLMKILQVLLACMKSKAAASLSNQHVCNIVNTCFRVVHQAGSKGELLQRIARHTMHELVRCIFSQLPHISCSDNAMANKTRSSGSKMTSADDGEYKAENAQLKSANNHVAPDGQSVCPGITEPELATEIRASHTGEGGHGFEDIENGDESMKEPFGIPCMVEIFQFLCSLLNAMEHFGVDPKSNPMAYEEDVPLFALGLINSVIELGGSSFSKHRKLLVVIQDELFRNLMQFGLSMSPLILSTVCSIILNLYYYLRTELKVQLEAFFSCVLLRLAQSKHGFSYQQKEVAMEALVDLCRQPSFIAEIYTNFDCDITCSDLFEELVNMLSKSAFPVNGPLSAMHILALDGLVSVVKGMSERIGSVLPVSYETLPDYVGYEAFWTLKCENFSDPDHWVPFVRKMKHIKKKLMVGTDHFNRDPKKGLEFLQEMHLLPAKLDAKSVASFFRYTVGLDKNLIGDFLGKHDEFCIEVLSEFAGTFDFRDMNLDTALRLFLGTFRLPGESQKIQRVLEAFAERYYQQSPHIFSNRDAALLLSYSIILLNTDQHNVQVKRKMTEEDFIRNNRNINGGKDLPREFLSELYHSICENEIQMIPEQGAGFPVMTSGQWITVMHKSREISPFITWDSRAILDHDMFALLSGPIVAAISVVFDQAEQEEILQTCTDGLLSIAKISAHYYFDGVLNDLVVYLCKFTTLLTPLSAEEALFTFGEDARARMATTAVFTIANNYGDYINSGWRNIFDCVLGLRKHGLLPASLARDAADDVEFSFELEQGKPAAAGIFSELEQGKPAATSLSASHIPSVVTTRKSSSLIGRFSLFLSFDVEEPNVQPTEEQLAVERQIREIIQNCHIDSIFTESKFLQAESLLQLVKALISVAGGLQKSSSSVEYEDSAVFCLELLIAITLNNRDRIMLIWKGVYEHIANIVQYTLMPCTLVEKAVFGLLKICQRLLPYKENLTDELLKSLQLILKLDARVADAYCEPITQEVTRLVKANATHISSNVGWRTIVSLLSITARHPEASESGFEALTFIMSDGAHLLPSNFVLCVDAARQFAGSRVGQVDRSISALDMMADSVFCLTRWSNEAKNAGGDEAVKKVSQDIGEMWLRLVQALKKACLDQREEVRNHSILMLQRSLAGVDGIQLPSPMWLQCFDHVIFTLLDEVLDVGQGNSAKEYKKMEDTLVLAMKLMSKAFLQLMRDLSLQPSFCKLWLGVLNRMEKYMKVKIRGRRSEKIHELVPELLKNTLLVMKTTGILMPTDDIGGDSFWKLTWLHVKNVVPSLQQEVFPEHEVVQLLAQYKDPPLNVTDGEVLVSSSETKV